MSQIDLSFAFAESPLEVRRFVAREALSSSYEITAWFHSRDEDMDLDAITGNPASFRVSSPLGKARSWSGICRQIEQIKAEPDGLSTYVAQIVPRLWLLTQRRNHRIFQHLAAPDIVDELLREWRIEPAWRIHRGDYPRYPCRVQYGETDFAFLCRVLEEAGIAFGFGSEDAEPARLVLWDRPHLNEVRPGPAPQYSSAPSLTVERDIVTHVRVMHDVRPGRCTIRDFDFRRPDYPLIGAALSASAPEEVCEQYHYLPGAFAIEGPSQGEASIAGLGGATWYDARAGRALAERSLDAERSARRRITFDTTLLDLHPGAVMRIDGHPRRDLAPETRLLVTGVCIEGGLQGGCAISATAVFAARPYRPLRRTPKPRIYGLQSALVVGPGGDEIHTDEHGRVLVRFPWDRGAASGDANACWLRVSHGAAGAGFGATFLPRAGQEVLVGFLEGDPDQPVVVGRVFNATSPVPYKLPEHKTVSTWRSASSPGGRGFNEIMFDDAAGREIVHMRAERDLTKLVKVNEAETTGANRTISVGGDRIAVVGGRDEAHVGTSYAVEIQQPMHPPPTVPPTGLSMGNRRISLTTGEAALTLDGPNIELAAKGWIRLGEAATISIRAGAKVVVECASGGEVVINGGPEVKINCPETEQGHHGA